MKSDILDPTPSEFNRLGRKGELAMHVATQPVYETAGVEYGVGYYLDENSIVQIYAGWGNDSRQTIGDDRIYHDGMHAGGTYQKFLGNSLNIRGGFSYREVNSNTQRTVSYGYYFYGKRAELNLYFGNQWQWKQIFLGIDWLNFTVPFMISFSDEALFDPSAQNQFNHEKDQFGASAVWGPSINLGFAF